MDEHGSSKSGSALGESLNGLLDLIGFTGDRTGMSRLFLDMIHPDEEKRDAAEAQFTERLRTDPGVQLKLSETSPDTSDRPNDQTDTPFDTTASAGSLG